MQDLTRFKCVPCSGEEPVLDDRQIALLHTQVSDWTVFERDGIKRLERRYKFPDFAQALEFTNRIGVIAEEEGHHPAILTEWGKVTVTWWTHKIKGLHQNDFIMAAKTDQLYQAR